MDLIVLVDHSDQPFERRGMAWNAGELPVPADVLVYTVDEWQTLSTDGRFYRQVMREAVWVWPSDSAPPR